MVLEKLSLEGKSAIVTGGGTGLGRAMSLAMAKAGADIALAARRLEPLERTAAEIKALGRGAVAIPTDITVSQQVNDMVARAIAEFGKIDVLVNNAGIVREHQNQRLPIEELTDEQWRRGIDTNLTGTFYCCRAIAGHMRGRKQGKIINVASGSGIRAQRNHYVYSAAKAGVIQFTKVLGFSWASENIQVNCIVPGFFTTESQKERGVDTFVEGRARFNPMGRTGSPSEIGLLTLFLASDASSYITSEVFCIEGGALSAGYAPTEYAPRVEIK